MTDGRKCKVWEYGKAGSMGGGGLILRQIQSKSLVSCNNKWFSVQLALVAVADVQKKKNVEAEIVSQWSPAAVRLAKDSWEVKA